MNRGSAASVAAIVLALTGCSSSTPAADSSAAKSTVTTAVTKSGAKTTAPKASATKSAVPSGGLTLPVPKASAKPRQGKPVAGCFKVDSATGVAILSGAKPGSGAKFVKAAAVQSPYYGNMYLAAVEFSTTAAGKNVGVFVVSEVTGKGPVVMSVDAKAMQFTVWQDTDHSATKIGATDPYLTAAKACLK